MQNNPHQAQKTIFTKFEQWGMGLDMFWWSIGVKLQNLSLIYEMMMICEKTRQKVLKVTIRWACISACIFIPVSLA